MFSNDVSNRYECTAVFFFFLEQLDHFRKHMEAGETNTIMSEDDNEEDPSSGGKVLVLQLFKCIAHTLIIKHICTSLDPVRELAKCSET